jgi:hypothetical protein
MEPEKDYGKLLLSVEDFIKRYLEMPHNEDFLILALWVFHTYVMDQFDTTPIMYFYGVAETGKTRAGEILQQLGFFCERMTAPTESTLFRAAQYFKTALVIDEIKLWGPDGNKEVATLIKSRYKRGMKVSRINMNKSGEEQLEYFDVFAPLVICSTESLPPIIESRCFTFVMNQNIYPDVERKIDTDMALELRKRLTWFRFEYMDKPLPIVESVSRRRLNEIAMPLYTILMAIAPERQKDFENFIEICERQKRDEETMSLEADIVKNIVALYKHDGDDRFRTTDIVSQINNGKLEKECYSDRMVGVCIRRLGFEKCKLDRGSTRGYRFNVNLIKRLCKKYEIDCDFEDT